MAECILKCGYLYTGVLHSNENEWIRLNDIYICMDLTNVILTIRSKLYKIFSKV